MMPDFPFRFLSVDVFQQERMPLYIKFDLGDTTCHFWGRVRSSIPLSRSTHPVSSFGPLDYTRVDDKKFPNMFFVVTNIRFCNIIERL